VRTYLINEIFYSLQGEGVRIGTANVFVRFARCNQQCRIATHGFDCDTDFEAGRQMTIPQIVERCRQLAPECNWLVLTGGEPALQVDRPFIDGLHEAGYKLAIETNGTVALPDGIDWITVSPKADNENIRQRRADEVKYVRAQGQPIPDNVVEADHVLISPAFEGDRLCPETLAWCIALVKREPSWRLSVQMHKFWRIP
jgi:7-carboxy-7-deazaguanine synthase